MHGRASKYMKGYSSQVRLFPVVFESGKGCTLTDVDGNTYIDYVLSWGPMILGHAAPSIISAIKKAAANGTSYGAPTELEVLLARCLARAPEFRPAKRTAVVLGSEEKGIRRLAREKCDGAVRIPMTPGVESLNVSVAGGIIAFSIRNPS